jgi:hypothetical protein
MTDNDNSIPDWAITALKQMRFEIDPGKAGDLTRIIIIPTPDGAEFNIYAGRDGEYFVGNIILTPEIIKLLAILIKN